MNYKEITDQVVNGDINALKAYIDLKVAEKELEYALAVVQPLAINEADKYTEKTFKAFGAVIEKRSAPGRWDYAQVNAWKQAKDRLAYIEKISQAGGGADMDSGEVIDKAIKIPGKAIIAINLKNT